MMKKVDLLDERSDYTRDVLEKTPSWIVMWGNAIFFVFIVLLMILGWLVRYPDVVVAEAIVTPKNPPLYLQPKVSGNIDNVYVENNEFVSKGQWLLAINTTANLNHIKTLSGVLDNLDSYQNIDSLLSINIVYLDVGEMQIEYDKMLSAMSRYQNYVSNGDYYNQRLLNSNRVSDLREAITSLRSQREIAKRELELNKINLERQKKLVDKGVVSNLEYESVELSYLQSSRHLEQFDNQIYQLGEQIKIIEKESKNLFSMNKEENLNYQLGLRNAIKEMKTTYDNWKNEHLLVAPTDGLTHYLEDIHLDKYLVTGKNVLSIEVVDTSTTNKSFVAQVKMPVVNAGKVQLGQTVQIKLNNYPFEEYGMLNGKVKSISNVFSDSFYYVEVHIGEKLVTSHGYEIEKNQLLGLAEIITADVNLIQRVIHKLIERLN